MKKEETTLSQDVKTMWIDGCKSVVSWLQSFGQSKLPKHGMMTKEKPGSGDFEWFEKLDKSKEAYGTKPKRARTKKGRYRGDNLATEHINEAWVGGKAPKKRGKKNDKKI